MLNNVVALLDSGAAAGGGTAFESIATVNVGAGGSSSITFSSIPSTYKHLQIRGLHRTNNVGGTNWYAAIRLNGDTGSNYTYHGLRGDGSAAVAYAGTSQTASLAINSGDDSNLSLGWGAGVVDILDYANTNKYKTIRSLNGYDQNGYGQITLNSGLWQSSNAVSSITLFTNTGVFQQYSSFALYGIRA